MKRNRRGSIGTSLTSLSESSLALTSLATSIELKRLGRKAHRVSHGHRLNVLRHKAKNATDYEVMYHLIDYRDGNKVLLKKAMTRLEAFKKNRFLTNSGKAWAMVQS